MTKDLTKGNIFSLLIEYSLPYLVSCFLQTFYGLSDLFIVGRFNAAEAISAVSIGSQIMHMATVVIAGLVMGGCVQISRAVGAKDFKTASKNIGNTILVFLLFSVFLMSALLFLTSPILQALSTPLEAIFEAKKYLFVCFLGIPFIVMFNVFSGIFRAMGDTKTPLFFVVISGIVNIFLDYVLIGHFSMSAFGAAIATVSSQFLSVILAIFALKNLKNTIKLSKNDFRFEKNILISIFKVGFPIAMQDGFIQISFLVITFIANMRGLIIAASVGITEKIISFLFLVNSSMLSSVCAIASQNAGAKKDERGKKALLYGIIICATFGFVIFVLCQFFAQNIVSLFSKNSYDVIFFASQYLKAYSLDCIFAGIHFVFSGYFCAYNKSFYSFLHNIISVVFARIPLAYFASVYFPETLYPMGLSAPLGSLLSCVICVIIYNRFLFSTSYRTQE